MVHPWDREPRHKSWASDTLITGAIFALTIVATVVTDILNGPADPPAYLTGLLGAASLAFFGAVGSDKNKRDKEIGAKADRADRRTTDTNITAIRAEAKVDHLIEQAKERHPDVELPARLLDPEPEQGEPIGGDG